jgi:hypothetical protein
LALYSCGHVTVQVGVGVHPLKLYQVCSVGCLVGVQLYDGTSSPYSIFHDHNTEPSSFIY